LIRNHLLCPYNDCIAHKRSEDNRIRVLVDEKRRIMLEKSLRTDKKKKTRLPYLNKKWVIAQECPFCHKDVEIVVDETHFGRNITLRLPR
jgi:hypothetical protein